MELLKNPLRELKWFAKAEEKLRSGQKSIQISGCVDSEKLHIMNALAAPWDAAIIVTYSEKRAREIYEEYSFYDKEVMLYPAKDLIFYQADINGKQLAMDRMRVVKRVLSGEQVTVVTTLDALMSPMLPKEILEEHCITLSVGALASESAVAYKLVSMGYEKNYQVEARGQFSIRGGIIDIFDLTADNPVRIELWGDEVESIRSFDLLSQRSVEVLQEVTIFPGTEMVLSENRKLEGYKKLEKEGKALEEAFRKEFKTEEAHRIKMLLEELSMQLTEADIGINLESYIHYFYDKTGTFLDLFSKDKTVLLLDETAKLREHAGAVEMEFADSMSARLEKGYVLPGQIKILKSVEETFARMGQMKVAAFSGMETGDGQLTFDASYMISARSVSSFNGSFSTLISELKKYKNMGYKVVILSTSRTRATRLAADITEQGVTASYTENADKILQNGEIVTFYGSIRKGFEYPEIKFIMIPETDIFGPERKKKRRKPKYTGGQKVQSYGELKVGDYVIHENYGLGIYRGIEKVPVDRVLKDYMKIEYRDGGNLYVLATSLDMIQLYASKEGKAPKLNKLGTQEWTKTKTKVQNATKEVAKELVHLYAVRNQKQGFCFERDTVWQKEFEEMFPFEETEDQLTAIAATKDDMESTKIMDRLICGDVGYGKTEVAIRAAFKAVQEGKQVAYLVPTTILAQQHFNTFRQRMKDYPVRIEMLSRFCTPGENKKTLTDLKKGLVDIVIGTHRLLSKDVAFADLGLLIVDEEQRFGVSHKEKIKQMKENVDVLTLTATPIPRTLHMSLIGIRDMSILEEAPQDRQPIQTYVMEYNEEMVREAILRELSRGGQVYYVFNRVEGIAETAAKVANMVPEARVAFAHGQMKETELENIMMDFVNREIDVLVSTTIIETGLDIPNANTMIVHDSDNLGLSQLYQLRGRVGRSNRTSFAFLMYRKNKVLKEIAEKRLMAIKEFTDLGSGFKIAMRDLEIRGAGNILGRQQHGHMQAVGYDLYCKMLEAAVKEEKGISETGTKQVTVDLDVDAYLPETYIVNEVQKLDIYKRIASIAGENDYEEMRDELRDRFGEVPPQAEHLLAIALLKVRAKELYITEIRGKVGRIRVVMQKDAPVNLTQIPVLLNEYAGDLRLQTKGIPEFLLRYEIDGLVEKDEILLLEQTKKLLETMAVLYEED
ncbi:MAG: transcription-repair coupling factor [Lachnospiraceae bacterium]|nr:transcription-repair coupling factor [Lachnospiraceae bacterium]